MSGYWIIRGGEIKDEEALAEYGNRWREIAPKYEAKIIGGRGEKDLREGPHVARVMLVEFPSYAQAKACYDDADYRAAMEFAHKAYDRELIIVEGS